jgi:hypothetical protein
MLTGIDPFDFQDFIQIFEGRGFLHPNHNHGLAIGFFVQLDIRLQKAVIRRFSAGIGVTASLGVILYCLDHLLGVLPRVNVRHANSSHAHLEILHDYDAVVGWDPNHRHDPVALGGPDHLFACR